MKRLSALCILFTIFMCFSAGTALAEATVPDLTGTWATKSYSHHHEKQGFFSNPDVDGQWIIKKQQGRLFHGERSYTMKQISTEKITEGFSGVISKDGNRLYMVDHDEDILFGEILSNGLIELIMINDGDKNNHSKIGLMEIERVK